ncbi:hypothetical protein BDQ12DRAFT_659538 [Crucibulum laeve]|uniref:Methyltransferase domain-containing protein n=1 Tax=Crucibulum laeve TaxID=68775 RepID=A0A5C3LHJ0_9AGAR|nr:hypothetical protein BDQ12DRAFT_659538 [Crucibulum laeve]
MSVFADSKLKPLLDEGFYSLKPHELAFFKSQTGIHDPEDLKQHIIGVQKKAYEVYGYPCIRRFSFTRLKITQSLIYDYLVQIPREREGAVFLDIGCCFGTDIRKAVADGWPVENVIGSDLRKAEFWECGHDLFNSSPTSFPAAFVGGDAFELISPRPPFYTEPKTPRPNLQDLNSLTPLQGHISAIHTSSFFHLFNEGKQLELARRVATLLSVTPGSVIFGSHVGLPKKGIRKGARSTEMFCHSPETWEELWDGKVFEKGSVRVDTRLDKFMREDFLLTTAGKMVESFLLSWSVTRV